MEFTAWYIVVGAILVAMALAGSVVRRLPLTPSMFYLVLGVVLGPYAVGLIRVNPIEHAALVERFSEVVVIVSLFAAGLKLRTPPADARWGLPLRLATVSMAVTVGLIALVGVTLLDLPLGAAVLLGAVLAPTDPVLASDVQVSNPADGDRLRFSLTGEAGLNDGTAFPFVFLGLGLLGLRDLGDAGWRWLLVDVVWGVGGGLAIGWLLGTGLARLVLFLRRRHKEAVGLDEFLALGLLALAYGTAQACHALGFLAAFAAGLALRHVEAIETPAHDRAAAPTDVREAASVAEQQDSATHPDRAPAYMAQAVLRFNEQLERVAEVAMVILLGGILIRPGLLRDAVWFVPLLLLVIRPLAVWAGTVPSRVTRVQRGLIGWFGIRGVGSIYYLAFALNHGVTSPIAERLLSLTLAVVAVSITVHGISVTPLMNLYERPTGRGRHGAGEGASKTAPDEKDPLAA